MATNAFIELKVDGGVTATAEDLRGALLRAANGAAKDEATAVKKKLRADVVSGLGSTKLANTWRVAVYPQTGLANAPAIQITNTAADIIEAFSAGVTISAKGGNWLAIPSPETMRAFRRMVPRGVNGTFQPRGAWPQAVAAALGAKPQFFIEQDGSRGFVFVKLKTGRRILGWLVKQAVLDKRIRGTELLEEISAMLPDSYVARFNSYLDAELKAAGL